MLITLVNKAHGAADVKLRIQMRIMALLAFPMDDFDRDDKGLQIAKYLEIRFKAELVIE